MSRLTRVLVLGTMLGAMSLSMTTIAQAQTTSGDAVQRFRQGERSSQEQAATGADAVQRFRQGERASQEEGATGGDAAQRVRQGERDARAEPSVPVRAAEPAGQPKWL